MRGKPLVGLALMGTMEVLVTFILMGVAEKYNYWHNPTVIGLMCLTFGVALGLFLAIFHIHICMTSSGEPKG